MMLTLEMLPAGCGDCLWLEYGEPGKTHLVIIDGGVSKTAAALRQRLAERRRERGVEVLDVELIVVTHIDNDHIEGIIELLELEKSTLRVKDIWFNGIPQLRALPALPPGTKIRGASKRKRKTSDEKPADLMGSDGDLADQDVDDEPDEEQEELSPGTLPADLLGPAEGDALSRSLEQLGLPWNSHGQWKNEAIKIPDAGPLPSLTLDGQLKLTLLAPNLLRLHELCTKWKVVKDGREGGGSGLPADLMGRGDEWPPSWKNEEKSDPSVTNGSSITLLAEYGGHALLLAADAFAADMVKALERLRIERKAAGQPFKLFAFKLSHHGSDKNLTQELLEMIDCDCFLVSTDGSTHRHPDHQALLRILKFARRSPRILFNYDSQTTAPWRDRKQDVVPSSGFKDYIPVYPDDQGRLFLRLP